MIDPKANMDRITSHFNEELDKIGYDGVIGVARFADVYNGLMPQQQNKLKELSGSHLPELMKSGSVTCIGIAYPALAIESINVIVDGVADRKRWNIYAMEYRKINEHLNTISKRMADDFGGVHITATTGAHVEKVSEFYPLTISHRVVAENAGLGWRGKNELIVSEAYGCALRFASIISNVPLPYGTKKDNRCGACVACLDACAILKNKAKLVDYRANCWQFIKGLALEEDVCGKCIAACHKQSVFRDQFRLRRS